jgi:hypothetical protein
MDTEIQLGSPRYNCDRFGICRMDNITANSFSLQEGKALAKIHIIKNKYLGIAFYTQSITSSTFDRHFGSGLFTISADSYPTINGNFFQNRALMLKKGNYPITKTKYYHVIKIPCTCLEKTKDIFCQNKVQREAECSA